MAVVHFYAHETLERLEPTKGLGQRFRRWLVRRVSPKFGHCVVEFGLSNSWELNYDGYHLGKVSSSNDASLQVDHGLDLSGCVHRARPNGLKMFLAYFLPRTFDNCASFVGRLVYCPGARTPDELYRLLIDYKGAKPTGGEK